MPGMKPETGNGFSPIMKKRRQICFDRGDMINRIHTSISVLMVLCLLPCCTVIRPSVLDENRMASFFKQTPAQALAQLCLEKEKIRNLTAAFSLAIDPPLEKQPSQLRGVLIYARTPGGPCVRIKGQGLFGRLIFDLVQNGDDVRIYFPSEETLFVGRINPEKEKENVWANMFGTLFADLDTARASNKDRVTISKDHILIPLRDGRLLLDKTAGLLREWHQPGKVIVYDEYETRGGLPPVPTLIAACAKDGSRHAVCRLRQVRLNNVVSDIFDLSEYHPKSIQDLNQMQMPEKP